MLLTKTEIEAIPPGNPIIALQGVSGFWINEQYQQQLAKTIWDVQKTVFDQSIAFGSLFVRYFVISNNFAAVLASWNQANHPENPDLRVLESSRKVHVLGKNETWGDGHSQSNYGVVFLQESVALKLLDTVELKEANQAKHILAHEIAHSHEQFLRSSLSKSRQVSGHDWPGIKLIHAKNMWAEYFVETIAQQCFPVEGLFTIEGFMLMLRDVIEVVKNAIGTCRSNRELIMLWNLCGSKLSDLSTSLARLVAVIDKKGEEELLKEVARLGADWQALVEAMIGAVKKIPQSQLGESDFGELAESMGKAINLLGIYPRQHQENLLALMFSDDPILGGVQAGQKLRRKQSASSD